MWSSVAFLEQCQKLQELGFEPSFEPGSKIGRGFADLGIEEFCVLHPGNILSLFKGEIIELTEGEKHHFFEIPSIDQMLDELHKLYFDVQGIETEDQRSWQVVMRKVESEDLIKIGGNSVEDSVCKALCFALEQKGS